MARMPQTRVPTTPEARILICKDCHEEFVFTAAAQAYFADLGSPEDPKRCKSCHNAHKHAHGGHAHAQIPSV